jgi:serine protease DegQ
MAHRENTGMHAFRLLMITAVFIAAGSLPAQTPPSASAQSGEIATAVRQAQNSVVSIQTFGATADTGLMCVGSGFLFDRRFIVTRQSVVDGMDSVEIALSDGRTSRAQLIQSDTGMEIAVLEHGLDGVVPIRMGQSANLSGGVQLAILGNSLGIFPSVTLGRFIGRRPDGLMEIDGTIPPGNCGSPVLDAGGRLVAMIVGRLQDPGNPSRITGLALPVEDVQKVLNRFQHSLSSSGWIGISVVDLEAFSPSAQGLTGEGRASGKNPARRSAAFGRRPGLRMEGVRVVGVVAGGPADKAMIAVGDTIVRFMGNPVKSAWQVAEWVKATAPHNKITFSIRNGNSESDKSVTVAGRPRLHP